MKTVAKYNIYKGVSTALTAGTPIVTLLCCGDMFVHRSETAISAGGILAILLTVMLLKDKIVEHFKVPSAFVLSTTILILILLIENILYPMKIVCITTMITSGVDKVTFDRFCTAIEYTMPEQAKAFKHMGYYMCKTDKIIKEPNE